MLLALLVSSLALTSVSAIDAIRRDGKHLLKPNGDRFYIKGVAYQESAPTRSDGASGEYPEPDTFVDPLSSPSNCTRDLPFLQDLGVNTIRVYSVNVSGCLGHSH